MKINQIHEGNCLDRMKEIEDEKIDLIYFDTPFFTPKKHSLQARDTTKKYEFDDKYDSLEEYLELIKNVLIQSKRVLKDTGSVFLHCDKTASHHIRVVLDEILGKNNFQSEIIWSYKRWSNSKKGLLNSHQVIFFIQKLIISSSIPFIQIILLPQILTKFYKNENEIRMENLFIKKTKTEM